MGKDTPIRILATILLLFSGALARAQRIVFLAQNVCANSNKVMPAAATVRTRSAELYHVFPGRALTSAELEAFAPDLRSGSSLSAPIPRRIFSPNIIWMHGTPAQTIMIIINSVLRGN